MMPGPLGRLATLALVLGAHAWAQQPQLAQPVGNLLPNPSFEQGDARGPMGWQTRPAPGSTSRFEWARGVAHTGDRSLLIESSAEYTVADRWRTGSDRGIGLAPGTEATLSAWVRTEGAAGIAHVQLYAMGLGDAILAQPSGGTVTGTSDWTRVSVTMAVPDAPCYIMAYLGLKGAGRAWFDDVALTGVPGPGLPSDMDETTYLARHFEELDGYEVARRGERLVLQTSAEGRRGVATVPFYEATARWDVTLRYLDEPDGASTLRLLVNGSEVGAVIADAIQGETDAAEEERTATFARVDIQRYSRITVVGEADGGERARVIALDFAPVGAFKGELLPPEHLAPPNNLRVYQSPREREQAARMLAQFASRQEAADFARITAEIEALTTPEQARAWQDTVRARLPEIFGRWTGHSGSPLNPRVVGTIELDYCSIEKVIIESEPGVVVPLNVYVPKGKPLPAPGICITIGHAAEGKGYHLYHEFGLGLAEKGYVAVALDPLGQGERRYWADPPEELGPEGGPVGQHHYELRRGFLVGRSLSGLRTRDCVRVIDYMLTRTDIIDPLRIGVGGNSGGGQMALLTAACHPAVRVCAAAHPGGSCENTYFLGKSEFDRQVISLIPPRPLIWIVGDQSGETHHESRFKWLQPLYELFGAADAHKFEWVEGAHNLERPKREAAYEWFHRWLGMEGVRAEGEIEPLPAAELWCTQTGLVETSLQSVLPWKLDTRLMREMAPERPEPAAGQASFRLRRSRQVLAKLGLEMDADRAAPAWRDAGRYEHEALSVRKLAIQSEPGIEVGALVIESAGGAGGPTIVHASAAGKPRAFDEAALPFALALRGHRVVSVDVRGVGELDIEDGACSRVVEYDPIQWQRDGYAISAAGAGRPMRGARALDLIGVMDYLDTEAGTRGRYVLVGE
ncbi:MAG: prolyl oligopeptidase family serine peptidase, partial [Armatimonadota bacterium]